jgi:lipopolysaccharide transport system permease protein
VQDLAHHDFAVASLRRNILFGLWRYAELVTMMAGRDLAARYRGAFLGALWAILQPLVMLLLWTFIFSVVLRVKMGSDASPYTFALYLMAAMLPWLAISESVGRSVNSVLENANLVKKIVFPLEVLPSVPVVSALVGQAIGTALLLVAIPLLGRPLHVTILLLPILIIPQILLTLGLAWLAGSVGVFVRDLGQFMTPALMTWMFLTPIFYTAEAVPVSFRRVFLINPLVSLVDAHRRVLLEGKMPDLPAFCLSTLAAAVVFVLGLMWFRRSKRLFADVL